MAVLKRKLSIANRRLRERSNYFSFLFVLFFFVLFCIIIVMQTILPKSQLHDLSYLRHGRGYHHSRSSSSSDEEEEDVEEEEYTSSEDFNWDISFDDSKSETMKYKNVLLPPLNNFISNTSINTVFNRKDSNKNGLKVKGILLNITATVNNKRNNSNNNNNSNQSTSPNNISHRGCCDDIETDWQQVTGSSEKFYIYSAYFVNDHIKVIGATKSQYKQHVQCRLYNNKTQHFSTVDGRIKTIRENWNLRYSACFIICNLPSKELLIEKNNSYHPTYISITTLNTLPSTKPSNRLKIQYASEKLMNNSISFVNFSLCVKPIYLNYNNILKFLETMEFHRLMGIEHFTFFNHSIGSSVNCIMNKVYNSTIISILPWNLPFISQKEIRTEGIFTALNDCVYRHRGKSKYLVIVDLDEAIVPRKTNKYSELLKQLDVLSQKKKIGAYSFQNAFFYLQFPDDPIRLSSKITSSSLPQSHSKSQSQLSSEALAQAVSQKLLMLRKTRRRGRFHPHKERSKYICDPNKVIEAGNHFIWEMEKGYYTLSVPSHLAALHHYRVCEFGGSDCIKNPSVVDKSVKNFSDELVLAVTNRLEEAAMKCNLNITNILATARTI